MLDGTIIVEKSENDQNCVCVHFEALTVNLLLPGPTVVSSVQENGA